MIPAKQNVIEVLRNVVYFPKGGNIVDLEMVKEIEVGVDLIRFHLYFEKLGDEKNQFLIDTAKNALEEAFKGVKVDIIVEEIPNNLSKVHHIIAVASGKGGVGKSTVSANLAIALALQGFRVGLLDADIYGPSVPIMFGTEGMQPECYDKDGKAIMVPVEKFGIKLMSIGNMVDSNQPLIWRGPMASSALTQLMGDTDWGEIDFMVVDMPPGTGDIQLCIAQNYNIDGAVIVTTPQKVAFADVRRAAMMFKHKGVNVPILGLVENMAYFTPSDMPEKKYFIYGDCHGREFAKELDIPFLAQIPIDEKVANAGDTGQPYTFNNPCSPVTAAFNKLANNIIQEIL